MANTTHKAVAVVLSSVVCHDRRPSGKRLPAHHAGQLEADAETMGSRTLRCAKIAPVTHNVFRAKRTPTGGTDKTPLVQTHAVNPERLFSNQPAASGTCLTRMRQVIARCTEKSAIT